MRGNRPGTLIGFGADRIIDGRVFRGGAVIEPYPTEPCENCGRSYNEHSVITGHESEWAAFCPTIMYRRPAPLDSSPDT